MKLPPLALTACLLAGACQSAPDAPQTAPEPAPEVSAPAAATGERVQPEIRYYEIADT